MKKSGSALILIPALLIASQAWSAIPKGIIQPANQLFYTLAPDVQISGPALNSSDNSQYVSDLFHILVATGDQLAQPYLTQVKDPQAYWAFMVATLAVPYHEADYQQFRALPQIGDLCEPINAGVNLRASKSSIDQLAYSSLDSYLLTGASPVLANCSSLDASAPATQLMGSSDWLSVGMMQLNIAYHVADYIKPKKYLSVQQTAEVGMEYFKSSINAFDAIYRAAAKYPCVREGAARGQPVNYTNLIRAAWSVYNGGSDRANVCRFAASNENDDGFLSDLNILTSPNDSYNVLAENLKGQDLLAYEEIVDNFKNGTNTRTNLDQILGTDSGQAPSLLQASSSGPASPDPEASLEPAQDSSPSPSVSPEMRQVNVSAVNVRRAPSLEWGTLCGQLSRDSEVQVLENDGVWSKIQPVAGSGDAPDCGGAAYVVSAALSPIVASRPGTVVRASYLNVRKDVPEGAVIAVVRGGASVQIIGEKKESPDSPYPWYRISPSGGWIYGRYINTTGADVK